MAPITLTMEVVELDLADNMVTQLWEEG